MDAIIPVLFFLCFILLLCALAGLVRPHWLHLKTRKEAAQAAVVFLILLFILGPFLPDTDKESASPRAEHSELAEPVKPVCEDLTDRMERLECAHRRALLAWQDSIGRISSEHIRYLTTACPPCEAQLEECLEVWRTRNPGKTDPPEGDFNRCMDRAWPSSEWPRYEALREALPAPNIPPELSARWRDVQRRVFSGQ